MALLLNIFRIQASCLECRLLSHRRCCRRNFIIIYTVNNGNETGVMTFVGFGVLFNSSIGSAAMSGHLHTHVHND